MFQRMEGLKQNSSSLLNFAQIKRNVQENIRYSDALKFPEDAIGFLCPVDTKYMKKAGENVFLTRFTYRAREEGPSVVLEALKCSDLLLKRRNFNKSLRAKLKDNNI